VIAFHDQVDTLVVCRRRRVSCLFAGTAGSE